MKLPVRPPSIADIYSKLASTDLAEKVVAQLLGQVTTHSGAGQDYLHWDRLRHKRLPDGIADHEQWWLLTKLKRRSAFRKLPLTAMDNSPFNYWLPDSVQHRLHKIDQQASGRVSISETVTNPHTRDRYLVNSLIEEAITSSQLEGASTTRSVAKAMLREQRQPRDKSERMIVNNYRAMNFVREVANDELTPRLLLELHKIVTDDTLEDPESEGRLRLESDEVAVYDNRDNTLLHLPPSAGLLHERIAELCEFANSETSDDSPFLHPVVKSIILHFMIGYDHPFVDGNGRIARALFYWSMARQRYWMMEYISISTVLRRAPVQYARAYLYTETDDNDLTYFLDYNTHVVTKAIEQLQHYLATKAQQIRQVEKSIGSSILGTKLNHRQLALISHALRNANEIYSIESHRESHRVSYPTARSDLLGLVDHGLLTQRKIGKAFAFLPIDDLQTRLNKLGENIA